MITNGTQRHSEVFWRPGRRLPFGAPLATPLMAPAPGILAPRAFGGGVIYHRVKCHLLLNQPYPAIILEFAQLCIFYSEQTDFQISFKL